MSIEIQPYFAEDERYPALVGVRVEGDEYETAYVSKSELVDALVENAKLRELLKDALINLSAWMGYGHPEHIVEAARELGVEVDG